MVDEDPVPADQAPSTPSPASDDSPPSTDPPAQPMNNFELEPSFKDFEPTDAFRGSDPALRAKIVDVERSRSTRADKD